MTINELVTEDVGRKAERDFHAVRGRIGQVFDADAADRAKARLLTLRKSMAATVDGWTFWLNDTRFVAIVADAKAIGAGCSFREVRTAADLDGYEPHDGEPVLFTVGGSVITQRLDCGPAQYVPWPAPLPWKSVPLTGDYEGPIC